MVRLFGVAVGVATAFWAQGCTTRVVQRGEGDGACPVATERCPCGPEGSCESGLDCRSNVCVDLSSGGTAGTGTSGGSGGSAGSAGATGGSGAVSGSGGSTGPGAALTVEEYCLAKAELEGPWCDYLDTCCSEADRADPNFTAPVCADGPSDSSLCVSDIQEVLDAGAVWDGTWATSCVIELAKNYPSAPSTCSGLRIRDWVEAGRGIIGITRIDACRQMIRGTTRQGEPCAYAAVCAPGLTCFPITGDVNDDYVCIPLGTTASKCVTDTQCSPELICVGSGDLRCGEPAAEGEDCLYDEHCESGLICPLGSCVPRVPIGQSCEMLGAFCELGLTCNSGNYCEALGSDNRVCTSSAACNGRCDSTRGACTSICGGLLF
jgi:hypothetical protein